MVHPARTGRDVGLGTPGATMTDPTPLTREERDAIQCFAAPDCDIDEASMDTVRYEATVQSLEARLKLSTYEADVQAQALAGIRERDAKIAALEAEVGGKTARIFEIEADLGRLWRLNEALAIGADKTRARLEAVVVSCKKAVEMGGHMTGRAMAVIGEQSDEIARLKGEIEGTDQLAADPEKWGLRAQLDGVTKQRDDERAEVARLARALKMLYRHRWDSDIPNPTPPFSAVLDPTDSQWCVLGVGEFPGEQHVMCSLEEAEARELADALNAVAEYLKPSPTTPRTIPEDK